MHPSDARSISGPSIIDIETAALTPLIRPSMLWTPEREAPSAWTEHVPFAFWLIDVLRPRRVVELGTHTGVSYSALCQAVKTLALTTSCFAVDTWSGDRHAGFYDDSVYQEFAAFHDPRYGVFSTLIRSRFDDALHHFEDGTIDLLHIDGLHTYEAVRHDFETWLPKLAPNAVVLFHDTNVRERNFGVFRLWNELTVDRPHFEFLHGYGLGVLGLGREYPDALDRLFRATDDHRVVDEIRGTFMDLGNSTRILGTQDRSARPGTPSPALDVAPARQSANLCARLSALRRRLPGSPGAAVLALCQMLRFWIMTKTRVAAEALARKVLATDALILQRDLLLKENAKLRRRLLLHLMEQMPVATAAQMSAASRILSGAGIAGTSIPAPAAGWLPADAPSGRGADGDQLLLIDLGSASLQIGRAGR